MPYVTLYNSADQVVIPEMEVSERRLVLMLKGKDFVKQEDGSYINSHGGKYKVSDTPTMSHSSVKPGRGGI